MDSTYDVVVVGAGAAGLRCAQQLTKSGLPRVCVLEARSVPGGRIYDSKDILERPVELGAELVHGPTSALGQFVQEHGLPIRKELTWAQGDGDLLPVPPLYCAYYFGEEKKLMRSTELADDIEHVNAVLYELANVPDVELDRYDSDTTLYHYLTAQMVSPRALDLADVGYGHTLDQDIRLMRLKEVVRLERSWWDDGDGDYRVVSGMGTVVDILAKGLEVRCSTPVRSIDYSGDTVLVECDGGLVFSAEHVVITPSPPIIAQISFNPPLPSTKSAAVKGITLRDAAKLIVVFKRRLWPSNFVAVMCTNCPYPEIYFGGETERSGILMNSGDMDDASAEGSMRGRFTATSLMTMRFADWFRDTPLSDAVDAFVAQLDGVLRAGGFLHEELSVREHIDSVHHHVWSQCPYIGGGYSSAHTPIGLRRELRTPTAGKLFWGGEASEDGYMTVSAALNSGDRTAQEVLQARRTSARL